LDKNNNAISDIPPVEHNRIIGIGAFRSESTYENIVDPLAPTWHTAKANGVNRGGKYSVVMK